MAILPIYLEFPTRVMYWDNTPEHAKLFDMCTTGNGRHERKALALGPVLTGVNISKIASRRYRRVNFLAFYWLRTAS